jgi:NAD+ synthase (glutamine-hydrolysing)
MRCSIGSSRNLPAGRGERALKPVLLVGAPLRRNGRLYNCAVVIARGRILGVVPKSYLPNYREYYEKRWFASGIGLTGLEIALRARPCRSARPDLRGQRPSRLRLPRRDLRGLLGADAALDAGALAGALVLCNFRPRTSSIGKARERALLGASQSARRPRPMSIRRRTRARAPPISPGMARR